MSRQKSKEIFRYGIMIATALFILVSGVKEPSHNWDMIAYVAASLHSEGYKGKELNEKTYAVIKGEVSDALFQELTSDNVYRKTVFEDPEALSQQLPFYTIRVVYVELISILTKLGVGRAASTYYISAISAAAAVLVLGMIFLYLNINIVMLPFVVLAAGFPYVASLSTPDALACLFSLSAIWFLVSDRNLSALSILISVVLPAIRTDLLLLSLIILAYNYLNGKRYLSIVAAAVTCLLYMVINKLSGNYGWLNIFNFTFIQITPYPADLKPSANIADYVRPYLSCVYSLFTVPHIFVYVFAIYYAIVKRKDVLVSKQAHVLFIIPFSFAVFHLILFPDYNIRFFIAPVCLIAAWLISQLTRPTLSSSPGWDDSKDATHAPCTSR